MMATMNRVATMITVNALMKPAVCVSPIMTRTWQVTMLTVIENNHEKVKVYSKVLYLFISIYASLIEG